MSEYRRDQDTVCEFFGRRCRSDANGYTPAADLYRAYKQFAEAEGFASPVGPKKFGQLAKKAFVWERPSGVVYRAEVFTSDLPRTTSSGGSEGRRVFRYHPMHKGSNLALIPRKSPNPPTLRALAVARLLAVHRPGSRMTHVRPTKAGRRRAATEWQTESAALEARAKVAGE